MRGLCNAHDRNEQFIRTVVGGYESEKFRRMKLRNVGDEGIDWA